MGYAGAVGSSVAVAVTLRKLTAGLTKGAKGPKLLLLNTIVNGTAGGCASFCNTYMMRKAERENGIEVFTDEKLTKKLGISKNAAEQAVIETGMTRGVMSAVNVAIPATMIAMFSLLGIMPQAAVLKSMVDVGCVIAALRVGLPVSQSLFPPVSQMPGS